MKSKAISKVLRVPVEIVYRIVETFKRKSKNLQEKARLNNRQAKNEAVSLGIKENDCLLFSMIDLVEA